jgi:hypothetical protein
MACFGLFVGGVTAVMALQIILAVFAPERPPLSATCDEALSRMSLSLQRARQSAVAQDGAERSLLAFREGLGPAWQLEHSVEGHCGEGTTWALATKELIALRYAEERFARLGGRSLHQARNRVHELIPSPDP